MKKVPALNNRTPLWFKEWFWQEFYPMKQSVARNSKLIYLILAAILASTLAGNGSLTKLAELLKVVFGG